MFRRTNPVPTALKESELASLIPLRELRIIERRGTMVSMSAGRSAIREGEIGRECMIIVEGGFAVTSNGVPLASLGAGDVVGEMALFAKRPRTATVTAEIDSLVYAFNPREFVSLLEECPTLAVIVRADADERSQAS
jgi:CRP/FNR family cyclic AMP-dependent transcriptional regulator